MSNQPHADASVVLSLRDRRRRDTVREIERAAMELFGAQGFAATTVQEIADAAGLSQRTFFRYCTVKVDAVMAVPRGLDLDIAEQLIDLPPSQRTGADVERAFAAALDQMERGGRDSKDRLRALWSMMLRDSDLHAAVASRGELATLTVAAAWSEEARSRNGGGVDDALAARLVIERAVIALGASFQEWVKLPSGASTLVDMFARACEALRR